MYNMSIVLKLFLLFVVIICCISCNINTSINTNNETNTNNEKKYNIDKRPNNLWDY